MMMIINVWNTRNVLFSKILKIIFKKLFSDYKFFSTTAITTRLHEHIYLVPNLSRCPLTFSVRITMKHLIHIFFFYTDVVVVQFIVKIIKYFLFVFVMLYNSEK